MDQIIQKKLKVPEEKMKTPTGIMTNHPKK